MKVSHATAGIPINVRYHAQDIYKESLEKLFRATSFRFWTMNDCDRANEDRFVLTS